MTDFLSLCFLLGITTEYVCLPHNLQLLGHRFLIKVQAVPGKGLTF